LFQILEGIIVKSTGSWYLVKTENNQVVPCRIPGKFRLEISNATNPVAVGDKVRIEMEPNADTGLITTLHPRRNYIIRKATNLSRQTHIIASNLDQAILVITLAKPRTSLGFIDRFLVTAELYQIPVILIFNKFDIYTPEAVEVMRNYEKLYTSLGYYCLETSALHGHNIYQLEQLLQNKTSLFSGHSGVGKSTLINHLIPGLAIDTKEISNFSNKGKHTTTFAEMHTLSEDSHIIDTPGIKEFGLVDVNAEELSKAFPEFLSLMNSCKFNNCSHLHEPGCAIVQALQEEKIAPSRYLSYASMLENRDYTD
jgi:ribosome biogenesis GTPase / thiamine phosphate phosphatase